MKIAFKLLRLRKDGSLGSLFINREASYPLNKWLISKPIKRQGFAFRPGWHACDTPNAPHLSMKGRVWAKVLLNDIKKHQRPVSQGGVWYTAKSMKILEIIQ